MTLTFMKPFLYIEQKHRSYPNGYILTDLGPPDMLALLNRGEEVAPGKKSK